MQHTSSWQDKLSDALLLYHQTPSSTIFAYAGLTVLFVYYLSRQLNLPLLSIPELLWNLFIRIMPDSLIFALDRWKQGQDRDSASDDDGVASMSSSQRLARKSEAMRRIIGLNDVGVMSYLSRPRALSGLSLSPAISSSNSPLPGLGNWDNSCYQNSVIQGLAALPSMTAFLDQVNALDRRKSDGENTSGALQELIGRLNDPSNAGRRLWTPAVLKSMSSWQQQDAQEYFSKVSSDLEKEFARVFERKPRDGGFSMLKALALGAETTVAATRIESLPGKAGSSQQMKSGPDPFALDQTISTERETQPQNPLEGLIAQRVGCLDCGYVEGLTMIPFNCLTLPLAQSWETDIITCLDEYTFLEEISDVECLKCTLLRHQSHLSKILDQLRTSAAKDTATTNKARSALQVSVTERLQTVIDALEEEDFSEATLAKKCQIPSKSRVQSMKSKQAVIARTPQALVMHVNRSVFNDMTGVQSKNYAQVRFPSTLDLSPWCLGHRRSSQGEDIAESEEWETDPRKSMLRSKEIREQVNNGNESTAMYVLRAVITHYGRHENGHYICHRQKLSVDGEVYDPSWWRLSDEDVSRMSEEEVLGEGGVFMLFYELTEMSSLPPETREEEKSSAVVGGENVQPVDLKNFSIDPKEEQSEGVIAIDVSDQDSATNPSETLSTNINIPEPLLPDPQPRAPRPSTEPPTQSHPDPPQSAQSNDVRTNDEGKEESPTPSTQSPPPSPAPPLPSPSPEKEDPAPLAPRMRTSGPWNKRGSVNRPGKAMSAVSSMVTAN
ncbi:hypothetical protein MMC25_007631 [Agyrium rufum]|nr:hypothetical protein [Agyrium rufum]